MSSETAVQQMIRLDAVKVGVQLWRNNNGACTDNTGRLIRYGLGNDSAKVNKVIKSSDLIGITPVTITPDMVGKTIGVFTAVEVKRSDWGTWTRFQSDGRNFNEREQAQLEFIKLVQDKGGLAGFASSIETFRSIVL